MFKWFDFDEIWLLYFEYSERAMGVHEILGYLCNNVK